MHFQPQRRHVCNSLFSRAGRGREDGQGRARSWGKAGHEQLSGDGVTRANGLNWAAARTEQKQKQQLPEQQQRSNSLSQLLAQLAQLFDTFSFGFSVEWHLRRIPRNCSPAARTRALGRGRLLVFIILASGKCFANPSVLQPAFTSNNRLPQCVLILFDVLPKPPFSLHAPSPNPSQMPPTQTLCWQLWVG